ncbi:MAG: HAD family hydrolase [Planctomycetota bacterium]
MWQITRDRDRQVLQIDTPVETRYAIPQVETDLSRIRAVMMDMDGSSTDTEKQVLEAMRQMMADALGRESFVFLKEDYPHIIGDSTSNHVTYLVRRYGLEPDRRDEYIARYYHYYHAMLADIRDGKREDCLIEPMPMLGEFLVWARGQGLKLGLVTSSLQKELDIVMPEVFRRLGWDLPYRSFYDATISADAVGEPFLKPHPNLYVLMAQQLGVRPGEAIVIEDSTAGMAAARIAGFSVAAVPHRHTADHNMDLADLGVMHGGLRDVHELLSRNMADRSPDGTPATRKDDRS